MQTRSIENLLPYLILFLALAIGFTGFFNRFPIFHDEIINTYKAHTGLIFDYALRPAFYFINYISYHFFGQSPISLTVASVFSFAITTFLLYRISYEHYGIIAGLVCASVFATSPLVFNIGIRGMAHIHAGMLAIVVVYFISLAFNEISSRRVTMYLAASGFFMVIMLAVHPTMLAFFVPLLGWALLGLFPKIQALNLFYPDHILRRHYLSMVLVCVISLFALTIMYAVYYQQNYLSAFAAAISKSNKSEFAHYFKPWYEYIVRVGIFALNINIALFVLTIYSGGVFFMSRTRGEIQLLNYKFALLALVLCICILTILSLSRWKFDRVLVSFMPIYALGIGLLFGALYRWLRGQQFAQFSSLFVFSLTLLMMAFGAASLYNNVINMNTQVSNARQKYFAFYSELANIPNPILGFISAGKNDNKDMKPVMSYAVITGKRLINLGDIPSVLSSGSTEKDRFQSLIISNKLTHFIMRSIDKLDLTEQQHVELKYLFNAIGARKVYVWRNLYDMWRIGDPLE